MKKYIIFLILIFFNLTFSNEIKKIQVIGNSNENILPDYITIQFEISTKNKDISKSSELNSKILDKFKKILEIEKINYNKLSSIQVTTNKDQIYENNIVNKNMVEYETTLIVDFDILNFENLSNIIYKLSEHNIYSIDKNINKNYSFTIISKDKDKNNSKNKAFNEFNIIKNKLSNIGLKTDSIIISGIDIKEISLEKSEETKIDIYNVIHKFQITLSDFNNIGKIIDIANVLNINTPSYFEYSFNDSINKKLYDIAYENAYEKAKKIAKNNNLSLKNPISIIDRSIDFNNTTIYFNNKYNNYYHFKISTEKDLLKEIKEIRNEINNNQTIIIPKKQNISKNLFIEFEMK